MHKMLKSLELCGAQRIGATPHVKGKALLCRNLAERGDGSLTPALPPAIVAELQSPPVACDRRDGRTLIITQEDDGTLLLACSLPDVGEAIYPATLLARVEESVVQGEACGDFLVLRGESGRLYYLKWADGYTWLGALPELPAFSAEAAGEVSFEGEVPAVSFGSAIADLRDAIDPAASQRVGEAVAEGLAAAMAKARLAGYCVMPVVVRVAWRLWDGRLLNMSAPVRVAGSGSMPGSQRVMLSLTSNAKGFTGTAAGSVSVRGYRLRVTPTLPLPPQWQGVVSGVEVWVSEECSPLREGESAKVSAVTQAGGQMIACSLPVVSAATAAALAGRMPMACHLVSTEWSGAVDVPAERIGVPDLALTGEQAPATDSALTGYADALLGYGGFLHFSQGGSVSTTLRGNPLVVSSITAGVAASVDAIWPQLRGGGAYTRQYLYLATDRGLVALTHDVEGRHTNCRPVSAVIPRQGLPTGEGLYVSGAGGELLLVRDARVSEVLPGVDGCESLARSVRKGWLYMSGASESIVIQERSGGRAFVSDVVCRPLAGCLWRSLAWFEQRLGKVCLYDLDRDTEGTPGNSHVYSLDHLDAPPCRSGRVARLYLPVSGSVVMATAVVSYGGGEAWRELTRTTVSGSVERGIHLPVQAPWSHGISPCYRLTVAGSFGRLEPPFWL